MKNKINRLFISVLFLALTGFFACKNKNLDIDSFQIERERVIPTVDNVSITGSYSFAGTVKGMKVNIGEKESLIDASTYEIQLEGTDFSVTVGGLKPSTEYYYRYTVNFGTNNDFLTEIKSFTTLDASTITEKPTVKTWETRPIDSTTFRIKCEVISAGGSEVTERGICWNTYGDPTTDDETIQDANCGLGIYTIRMEHLNLGTRYYVCAYAKNSNGISFGEVLDFSTENEAFPPQVSTIEVNEVTYNSAICLGNVSNNGGLDLIECGICWSENANPELTDNHAAAEEATLGDFRVAMTDLAPNKEYHVRAYAINAKGTTLADEVLTFTTKEGLPTVTTTDITVITATSAKGGGEVTDEGASPVTERGVCWSTHHNPDINDNHENNGIGLGAYTVQMTDLLLNQTYYVRAYATNAQGTAYGTEKTFTTTEGLPVVQTLQVTDILATTATVYGKVIDPGWSEITERGFCLSTIPNSTISSNYIEGGTGLGEYKLYLSNLTPGTTYYVKAYAKNSSGLIGYGDEMSFNTGRVQGHTILNSFTKH